MEEVTVESNNDGVRFDPIYFRSNSLLRTCRYGAQFPNMPEFLRSKYDNMKGNFSYLTESIEFPGKTLNTSEIRMSGYQKFKTPMSRDFNEVNINFYYPAHLPIFEFFSEWIETISSSSANNYYYDEITASWMNLFQYSDIAVTPRSPNQYSWKNDVVLNTKLYNYYPLSVASLASNWGDDGLHRVSVTFFYEYSTVVSQEQGSTANKMQQSIEASQTAAIKEEFNTSDQYQYLRDGGITWL